MNRIKESKLKKNIFVGELLACILGILLGTIYFYYFKEHNMLNINNIFDNLKITSNNSMINVILHNLKFVLLIVFTTLLTKNNLILDTLIGSKSFIYTVTLFNIAWKTGLNGLKISLILFLPFYVLYLAMYIILTKYSKEYIKKIKVTNSTEWIKYAVRILLVLLVIIVLSIIEFECMSHFLKFFMK